ATLCHGPWVLASAGLLEGRTLTSWPGIRDDLVNAGATWLDHDLVRDRNLTTSRGPQDMASFVPGMLDAFAATSAEPATTAPRGQSDRQPDAPVACGSGGDLEAGAGVGVEVPAVDQDQLLRLDGRLVGP